MAMAGLRFQASAFDPALFSVFPSRWCAVCASTTCIDDILGCGGGGIPVSARQSLESRFRPLGTQEKNFARVGVVLHQSNNFSVTMTRQEFTGASQSNPTTKELWVSRQRTLRALRPDICARLVQLVSKVKPLPGSDICQGNDLNLTAKEWRQPCVPEHQPGPHVSTLTLAGWSNAAY